MWDRFVIRRKMNSLSRRLRTGWAPANPITAWIASTSRCNLRCHTCPAHAPELGLPRERFEDMRPEVYERLRREVLPGLSSVNLSSLGEPFLAETTYRIIDDLLDARRQIVIVTNGTIVRTDYLERLIRSPAQIRVSIDGTTADVIERIREGLRFERVLEFMKTVKEIMDRAAHPKFEFHILWVITRSNVEQLPACIDLAHRFGVTTVSFMNFSAHGRTDDFAVRESLMDQPELVLPHWTRARERAAALGIAVPEVYFECKGRPEAERREHQPTRYDTAGRMLRCFLPWWAVHVDTDGTVIPCCIWPPEVPMGNLREQSFREIWNSPIYRRLRKTVNTSQMPEPCSRCLLPNKG